jgi:hypothetical protein
MNTQHIYIQMIVYICIFRTAAVYVTYGRLKTHYKLRSACDAVVFPMLKVVSLIVVT